MILNRNNARIKRNPMQPENMSDITAEVSMVVHARTIDIHAPVITEQSLRTQTAIAFRAQTFPYALIILASIIIVFGIVGIIYLCVSWSRYKAYKEKIQRMYVVPHYDPVYVEPNSKEYETQVLRMNVPPDESESYSDLQIGTGQQSPVSSKAATAVRASSIIENHTESRTFALPRATLDRKNKDREIPVLNPLFNHTSDVTNSSPTNENVTFRERNDYSRFGFSY